ncbi:L-serine ammonia-lyase, iron-sulfur-dependent, subunit alpha [Oceanirhabdus seepicola]|uniref:L-serine dehydratase n=1 Tax=Oceanirhabdus seepicola TaxID=2828781 RepID=A0A9J6P155_9CLOT|nr:L-serine ammonia-lyase, iron-sulfur-dependent, subunit alpha [Oceanirhabdus seepicola]MCM1990391.1 L-serine ammonia-lyase, iron-sulfur-dependent, subunit alpha [Oceanirhabdus seepicola]
MFVNTGKELIEACSKENISISEYTIRTQIDTEGSNREVVINKMRNNLKVMKDSAEYALKNSVKSVSGLIGGQAKTLYDYSLNEKTLTGEFMVRAMARALSCSEVNAAMGRIVAAPTAGSCGILPAVIISAAEKLEKNDEEMINALFTASGVGIIIAKNATLSGAEGGCQAECGSAAAMAAAAVIEMMGGTPEMALHGAAIVIKNILGLVCDPVAGLVEIPCAKRNLAGAVNALSTVDLVMSGVTSFIPFDDVVSAMYKVGKSLPCELRETALGGIATTETGILLKNKVL